MQRIGGTDRNGMKGKPEREKGMKHMDCPAGLGDLHEPGDFHSAFAHMVPAGVSGYILFGMRFVFGGGRLYPKRICGERTAGTGLYYCAGGADEGTWSKQGVKDAAG